MNWIKQLPENKTFLLSLWVVVCFGLFVNGINSFISSSEFWSIYLSQKIFSFDPGWNSVYLKPLFHLILSSVYLLNLNDFYHIYAVKILFSLNGVAHLLLVYKILSVFYKSPFVNSILTFYLFCSPLYLANYSRIRSDQVALTLFLYFIYTSVSGNKFKTYLQFTSLIIFPLIAFKHIYFSVLGWVYAPMTQIYKSLTKTLPVRKNFLMLGLLGLATWLLYFGLPAGIYLINSFSGSAGYFNNAINLLSTEWSYIYLATLPFLLKQFRAYLNTISLKRMLLIQPCIVVLIVIYPQKFNFFLAGLVPIYYIPTLFFFHFLKEKAQLPLKILLPSIFVLAGYSIYLARKTSHIFTLNNPQLLAVERMSKIISDNGLSYIDGMGILPRGNNLGCFVSPDDDLANTSCINSIRSTKADVVIVTNRLMSLPYDFNDLPSLGYTALGPNFFIKKGLVHKFQRYTSTWPPPSLIFSSEQLY